jgi:hypothetical protein
VVDFALTGGSVVLVVPPVDILTVPIFADRPFLLTFPQKSIVLGASGWCIGVVVDGRAPSGRTVRYSSCMKGSELAES